MISVDEEQSKRIQIMRGLAISSVVFYHILPQNDLFRVIVSPFLTFGVALFLFLSGLLTKFGGAYGGSEYGRFCRLMWYGQFYIR